MYVAWKELEIYAWSQQISSQLQKRGGIALMTAMLPWKITYFIEKTGQEGVVVQLLFM